MLRLLASGDTEWIGFQRTYNGAALVTKEALVTKTGDNQYTFVVQYRVNGGDERVLWRRTVTAAGYDDATDRSG